LKENSQNLTHFRASYDPDFKEKAFVEKTIAAWQQGCKAFTLYTSGSTGTPKSIVLSPALLEWSIKNTQLSLGLTEAQNQIYVLCCLPVQKTGGFMQLIRALHLNWHIHFTNPTSKPNLDLLMGHQQIDLVSLTPMQLEYVIQNTVDYFQNIKHVLIGGAAISSTLNSQIYQLRSTSKTLFWETYGMTETASHIALRQIGKDTYFKPQKGVRLSTDANEQLIISIPELNIIVGTNDVVEKHTDGFALLGRTDDVINSGGLKLHPAMLEPQIKKVLNGLGITYNFYLGKQMDKIFGEMAVLVLEGKRGLIDDQLLMTLKEQLPPYQHPKKIVWVEKISYTDTGKVKRLPL